MKYKIKFQEVENLINYLDEIVNEKMIMQIKSMNDATNKLVWNGPAYDATIRMYNNMMNEINLIPETLNLYISFLKSTTDNYDEGLNEIKKRFIKLTEQYNNLEDNHGI